MKKSSSRTLLTLLLVASVHVHASSLDQVEIEPAQRDLSARGSLRFQKQWLIAGAFSRAAAANIDIATLQPEAGKPLNAMLPQSSWRANTSYGDTTNLNEIVGAPADSEPRVVFAASTVQRKHAGAAELSIGTQGPVTIWLNGERVHERSSARPAFARDDERIAVQMKQGDNLLLLRLEQAEPSAWPFAVRVVEPGTVFERLDEIVPYAVANGNALEVHTDLPDRTTRGAAVEVIALSAGGREHGRQTAARGAAVRFDTSAWPDGAYEIRAITKRAWGEPYVAYVPWYKGDAAAAARRLLDAASNAGTDIYGTHLRLLAEIARDRAGGAIDASVPGLATRIHSALLEYEELELDRANQPGAVRAGGLVRLGYKDEVDDSVQFCRAYLPTEYPADQRWPLVLYLHGFNPANPPLHRWWSADQRHHEIADRKGVIYIEPHGRGNAQYLGLGERDVIRCIEQAKARFAIDDDRVYLTGESMGGHGTWSIATRNPQLFAAAAPVYGGWDFRVTSIAGPPAPHNQPRNAREFFVQERFSSFASVENLRNVPLLVLHGDADEAVSVENSRHAVRMIQRWGYDVRYWELPGWAHEDLGERGRIVDWLLTHKRNNEPRQVQVRSTDLAAARAHWLQVEALQEPQRVIRADAQVIEPGLVRVDTQNVAAFTLSLPAALRGSGEQIEVVWNGVSNRARVEGGSVRIGEAAALANGLRKKASLQGPISDIVNTPFMIVVGTAARDPQMQAIVEERAEDFKNLWSAWQYQAPRFKRDVDVTREDERSYSLILLGGPAENVVTRRLAKRLPMAVSRNSIEVDGKRWSVSDAVLQMIYPNPVAADRYVLVVAPTSALGMHFWKPEIVDPTFGRGMIDVDWAILDGRRPPVGAQIDPADRDIASGFFDANWRRDDRWTTIGNASLRSTWRSRDFALGSYAPPAEVLNSYVGDYQFARFAVNISHEDGKLVASVPFGPTFVLQPEGRDLFSTTGQASRSLVDFIRDANGAVVGLEVDMQGETMFGNKVQASAAE